VWLDQACLPYSLFPEWRRGGYHVALVYELDAENDRAVLGDVGAAPLTVTAAELAEARQSITSYKHRAAVVARPDALADPKQAALLGIRACAERLVKGRAKTFVLDGFLAWGKAVGAPKGKEAWATLFPPGKDVYRALSSTYRFIEQWSGGGLLRPLYADFLDEAARLCGRPSLSEVAEQYRACGALWRDVSRAALPDGAPVLRETRELFERSTRALREKGDLAVPDLRAAVQRLRELRAAVEASPLPSADVQDLFADMSRRILLAHQAEVAAQRSLAAASA
jgi:hypothetical protein